MEQQYLDLVKRVIETGESRDDRTGVGTLSIFGAQLRCSLEQGFPLLTTKKVFLRGIFEELMWFIRGQTDSKILEEKKVMIWKGNSSKEFLENRGLGHLEEGDCGAVYGHQWRHFNAKYNDCHQDYTNQGVDQLRWLIHEIKTNPMSRRLILTAWNPCQLDQMSLPPCHLLTQYYVSSDKKLSCHLYLRSSDLGLGLSFNIASYALLVHFLSLECNLQVGDLIISIGDAHIYKNHIEALREQLTRNPRDLPTIEIMKKESIENYEWSDIIIHNYDPHPSIKMDMAV